MLDHLPESFSQELLYGSRISQKLAELNTRFVRDEECWEIILCFQDNNKIRRNDGRLRDSWLRYEQVAESGALLFQGLDPDSDWMKPIEGGRLKPVNPRLDKEGKTIKYENPAGSPSRLGYFGVDLETWHKVARRYQVAMPEHMVFSSEGRTLGFWQWVQQHPEIPVILTEGEKKALCLLSLGYAAISLPGIWMGTPKTAIKGVFKLHPNLLPLTQKGRAFIVLFDHEIKPKQKQNIYQATLRLGRAIVDKGCGVKVALLPGSQKGVDDWVVALGKKGEPALNNLIGDAYSFGDYKKNNFRNFSRRLHKYKANQKINKPRLYPHIKLPKKGLICLKSDMGTGKTYLMEKEREANPEQRFLNNGHRVNLLRNLAKRLDTEMYSALNSGDLSRADALSITVDSLYKMANNLQAYGTVFVDESCQYLAHLLLSKTCKRNRAEILEVLEFVVYNAQRVVIADAHLDDVTIDFFRAMRPKHEKPHVIVNEYKSGGRDIYWYEGNDTSQITGEIFKAFLEGKKIMVVSSSKRYIKKLERTLLDMPKVDRVELEEKSTRDIPKVWSIHSENSGSEENIAFIREIDEAVKYVDVLLGTPSIGTGVDISSYHFDIVFGVFDANKLPATECSQMVWRYRPNVPTHIFVAPIPSFGYKECNASKIKRDLLQENRMTAFLIRIDRKTGKRGAEKDWALDACCRIQAQRNFSINNLRQDLRNLLEEMGNKIIPVDSGVDEQAKDRLKEAGAKLDYEYYNAVASAEFIDKRLYEQLQRKDYLSPEEFHRAEKFRIADCYGMEVTPELVERDDKGKTLGKLAALEATIAQPGENITDVKGQERATPPKIVVERDKTERDLYPLCIDWGNFSASWYMRHELKLAPIISRLWDGKQIKADDPMLVELKERAIRYAPHIKQLLGLSIPTDQSPGWYLSYFLQQLGLKVRSRKLGSRGERVRYHWIDGESLSFAAQVLEHRKRKREERERRREEQRERNRQHAETMQRLWGFGEEKAQPESSNNQSKRQEYPISASAGLLGEAAQYGAECIQALIEPWSPSERWDAIRYLQQRMSQSWRAFEVAAPDWRSWSEFTVANT